MKPPTPLDFTCPVCGGPNWGTFDPTPELAGARGLSPNAVGCCHGDKKEPACPFRWFRNVENFLPLFTRAKARA